MSLPASLAAAQEQLYRRRLQRRQERLNQRLPVCTDDRGRLTLPLKDHKQPPESIWDKNPQNAQSQPCLPESRPSETQAREFQAWTHDEQRDGGPGEAQETASGLSWLPQRDPAEDAHTRRSAEASLSEKPYFTLYPDLAVAMLQNNLEAPARIWLLLRHLDGHGCGWVSIAEARAKLTGEQAPLRVCGWRQLRNLLAQGDDIFWQRRAHQGHDGRIWLRSPVKVAAKLGLRRFSRRPVSVPVTILLDGIGSVRAHFYASFHSGRDTTNPIARQTLTDLTGVSRRSQQVYEARTGVKKQQNWAVGEGYSKKKAEQRAWQHGRALFKLHDTQGTLGPADQSYVAWQMPNIYVGPHAPQPPAQKKRLNRRLADLFNKGKTGNGERKVEPARSADTQPATRYFEHGKAAARSYTRNCQNDLYWRAPSSYKRYRIWHLLPAQQRSTR